MMLAALLSTVISAAPIQQAWFGSDDVVFVMTSESVHRLETKSGTRRAFTPEGPITGASPGRAGRLLVWTPSARIVVDGPSMKPRGRCQLPPGWQWHQHEGLLAHRQFPSSPDQAEYGRATMKNAGCTFTPFPRAFNEAVGSLPFEFSPSGKLLLVGSDWDVAVYEFPSMKKLRDDHSDACGARGCFARVNDDGSVTRTSRVRPDDDEGLAYPAARDALRELEMPLSVMDERANRALVTDGETLFLMRFGNGGKPSLTTLRFR